MLRSSLLILAACAGLAASAAAQQLFDPDLSFQSIATGASQSTGIRFVTADEFFVIEKASGRVLHNLGGVATEVLDLPVNSDSERGLLGIELHPQFASNGFVYLYFTLSSTFADTSGFESWNANILSRFRWNGTALVEELQLFSIPKGIGANGPNHDGGPLRFGPDGKLYLVTGDLNRRNAEQNVAPGGVLVSAGTGAVHRFNDDGTIPADNPFNDPGVDPVFHSLFAYGVRNSFGLAFDPVTGVLWDTENGEDRMDEINRVESGFNSGWITLMGPDSRDPGSAADLVDLLPGKSFYSDPEFSFAAPIGITAMGFLAGSNLGPTFDDVVWFGDTNTSSLYQLRLNPARDGFVLQGDLADGVVDGDEADAIRAGLFFFTAIDIQLDPNGDPTILRLNGTLHRITLADSEGDGTPNLQDNCRDVANPGQEDVDAGQDDDSSLPGTQSYGDACDVDLDNDGVVGPSDFFGIFRPCLGADLGVRPECLRADLDGDGTVGAADFFSRLRPALGSTPGPGLTAP